MSKRQRKESNLIKTDFGQSLREDLSPEDKLIYCKLAEKLNAPKKCRQKLGNEYSKYHTKNTVVIGKTQYNVRSFFKIRGNSLSDKITELVKNNVES